MATLTGHGRKRVYIYDFLLNRYDYLYTGNMMPKSSENSEDARDKVAFSFCHESSQLLHPAPSFRLSLPLPIPTAAKTKSQSERGSRLSYAMFKLRNIIKLSSLFTMDIKHDHKRLANTDEQTSKINFKISVKRQLRFLKMFAWYPS